MYEIKHVLLGDIHQYHTLHQQIMDAFGPETRYAQVGGYCVYWHGDTPPGDKLWIAIGDALTEKALAENND